MAKTSFQPLSRASSDRPVEVNTAGVPDEVEVDLDNKDPHAFEIVVEDDTPEQDRGRPTRVEDPLKVDEKELRGLSDKAQKRISRLGFERETERRGREQAERTAEAALAEVRAARAEVERYKTREGQAAGAVGTAMLQRHEAALAGEQAVLQKAIEDGDAAAQAASQVKISTLTSEITTIRQRIPKQPAADQQQQQQPQTQPVQTQQVQQPASPAQDPRLHPKVRAWLGQHSSWFGQIGYEERTRSAINIEQQLATENVPVGSPEYIKKLDERMTVYYPDHQPFKDAVPQQQQQPTEDRRVPERQTRSERPNAGTEVTRDNVDTDVQANADPRKVRLTATQVALAKRLGIPLQRYAAEVVAREQAKGGAQ